MILLSKHVNFLLNILFFTVMVSSPPWQEKEPYRGRNGPKLFSRIIYILLFAKLQCFSTLYGFYIYTTTTDLCSKLACLLRGKKKVSVQGSLAMALLKKEGRYSSALKEQLHSVPSEVCALALGTSIANSLLPHFARKSGLVRKKRETQGKRSFVST